MTFEAKILKAISETMTCDKCPYPCRKQGMSSQANCVEHWSIILSQIDTKIDWAEACADVAFSFFNDEREQSEISKKQSSEIEGIEEAALAAGLRGDEVTMYIAEVLEKNGRYDLLPPCHPHCHCKGDDE